MPVADAIRRALRGRSQAETSSRDFFMRLEQLGEIDERDCVSVVHQQRLRFTVPVRQGLVLITQIQRSGGTLVSQLLDGHSELHVHPSELHIGRPNKYHWPELDRGLPPTKLFRRLREKRSIEHAKGGYHKLSPAEMSANTNPDDVLLPFVFLIGLQEKIFCHALSQFGVARQRDILDAYVTSYFNAWIDYAGLYRAPESVRHWVSFIPRFAARPGNLDGYFADYPDGKVIVSLRDPVSWYASARRHTEEYASVDSAIDLWLDCQRAIIAQLEKRPREFLLVRFEDLVGRTEEAVRSMANFLGIRFEPILLRPTFNGMDIVSDSSFGSKYGIDKSAVDRSDALAKRDIAVIRDRTSAIYETLLARAQNDSDRFAKG